jgi:hypothetical protein
MFTVEIFKTASTDLQEPYDWDEEPKHWFG